jgi:uncharacterized phage protein (TIGR01671 family)
MKREIKFRGLPTCKDKDELDYINFDRDGNFAVGFYEDGYIIGNVAESSEDYISPEFWIAVDRNTVGQYTGLHDKNGREIYECDIVHVWDNGTAVVKFDESLDRGQWMCEFIPDEHNAETWSAPLFDWLDGNVDGSVFEILGNIYEHPELLEEDIQ